MKFGPKSPTTYQELPERKSQNRYVNPSQRHALVKMLANKHTPFCNYLGNKSRLVETDYGIEVLSRGHHQKVLHATKGFRRISGKRL